MAYTGPPGATTYAFEKANSGAGPFVPLSSGTSSTFQDTGLSPGTTYFYRGRVQVVDGRFSSFTTIKSATTLASPPATPTGVVATDIDTVSISVSWNSVDNLVLAAPSDLWIALQGQTVAQSNESAGVPTNPNTQTIEWLPVTGATSYKVYRATGTGAETLLASGITGTSYTDNAATGCVNGTAGPVGGVYYGATSYRYRVSTVNATGEGAKTATGQKYYVYNASKGGTNLATVSSGGGTPPAGGFKWWGDFTGSVTTTDYASLVQNETGTGWSNIPTASSAYILPVCGGIYTKWNMWMGNATYLYLDIFKTDATTSLGLHGEIIGDLVIQPTGSLHPNQPGNLDLQAYIQGGPVTANAWFTYRVPIADFMTYTGGILQHQVYKFLIQVNGGANVRYFLDNVYYGE